MADRADQSGILGGINKALSSGGFNPFEWLVKTIDKGLAGIPNQRETPYVRGRGGIPAAPSADIIISEVSRMLQAGDPQTSMQFLGQYGQVLTDEQYQQLLAAIDQVAAMGPQASSASTLANIGQ